VLRQLFEKVERIESIVDRPSTDGSDDDELFNIKEAAE